MEEEEEEFDGDPRQFEDFRKEAHQEGIAARKANKTRENCPYPPPPEDKPDSAKRTGWLQGYDEEDRKQKEEGKKQK